MTTETHAYGGANYPAGCTINQAALRCRPRHVPDAMLRSEAAARPAIATMHVEQKSTNTMFRSGGFSRRSSVSGMTPPASVTRGRTFDLPPPAATEVLRMKDGAAILLRRFGRAGATRIILSHGNGLAINAYAPFWMPLAERYDVVLFDMRNHGENPLHEESGHRWSNFYSDIEETALGIREKFGPAKTIGVFHSLSSIAALKHALLYGRRWDALCVFDSPIMPPSDHPLHASQEADMKQRSAHALRRVERFESPEQLANQYRRHPAFQGFVPGAAALLARHTLRKGDDGFWTLSCPRHYQARTFRKNADTEIFHRLSQMPMPLRIIASDPDSPHAIPTAAVWKAANDAFGLDYIALPNTTHFLQIEQPQTCRDLLDEFITRHGLAA
jgi:pimeloyl-ACP methyl ester carboxylesterase